MSKTHPIIQAHSGLDAISMLPGVRITVEWGRSVTVNVGGQRLFITTTVGEVLFEDVMRRAADDFIRWLSDHEDEYHRAKQYELA